MPPSSSNLLSPLVTRECLTSEASIQTSPRQSATGKMPTTMSPKRIQLPLKVAQSKTSFRRVRPTLVQNAPETPLHVTSSNLPPPQTTSWKNAKRLFPTSTSFGMHSSSHMPRVTGHPYHSPTPRQRVLPLQTFHRP